MFILCNEPYLLRYSGIPVVAAPHQLTLGGGCEVCLHVDKVVAHAETYVGLVEFGVGVIPGGGGTNSLVPPPPGMTPTPNSTKPT